MQHGAPTHNAAAAAAPSPAPAAAATVIEWADILAYCKEHQQSNAMNNYALKYYRWSYEDPAGVPSIPGEGVEFDLTQAKCFIYAPRHEEKGTKYWFDNSCGETQPWSWRHLQGSLRKGPKELFASPVVSLRFVPIPGTCDHHRLANDRASFGAGVLPPIWDFVVGLQDGTLWRVHPRYRGGKVDIAKWDGANFDSLIPKAGPGMSDGKGTYQHITKSHYGPDVGQYYHEPGVDPRADHFRSLHLAQKKGAAVPAAAGTGAASSSQPPASASASAAGGTPAASSSQPPAATGKASI